MHVNLPSASSPEFDIYLIKPTRYDEDGYPLQWWRSIIPSNSLACLHGIAKEALSRDIPVADVKSNIFAIDEFNTTISVESIIRRAKRTSNKTLICLVGVQTNQFPRAVDLARPLVEQDIPVCIGGFHVSGCMSMLDELPPDITEAKIMGISLFGGELEDGRFDEILQDAWAGKLKPIYNHMEELPNLAGAPVPSMPVEETAKVVNRYTSFDLGRGCPFECSFCTIINVQGRKSRFRTPDDLEAIVRENAKLGIDRFFVTDDNFARNKAWRSFTDRLIRLKDEGLAVKLVIQVDVLAHRIDGFIEQCVKAGADEIFIGLENINAASLEFVKKRQNRIEEYREMFLEWKKYPVVITCGYIIGFPTDTPASIARDIEIVKRELPIDTLYLNYLTPLPGSEDHKNLYETQVWMDPDMNKYDLNHRVTHHAIMTDQEWEDAYRLALESFYSWGHIETILKRMVALGSNKKLTTVNRILMYSQSTQTVGVSPLESGFIRLRNRKARRFGMPLENPFLFYPKYAYIFGKSLAQQIYVLARLRLILRRVWNAPDRYDYKDAAITRDNLPDADNDILLDDAHISETTRKRIARKDAKKTAIA